MTHDELLAKITNGNISYKAENLALRAIVNLHHPLYYRHGEIETRGAKCSDCNVEYPCNTIQAIEQELI